ncbi:MAG: hypothetical protein ACRERD_22580, partial [Candidatus Binatia bacterium]
MTDVVARSNGMDGISLDWGKMPSRMNKSIDANKLTAHIEYPGAQDLPERPTAAPLDGKAFLELLKVLRKKLDKNKTISIMAPCKWPRPLSAVSKLTCV